MKTTHIWITLKIQTRTFNGINYVMEEAIWGDYSLIKAWRADKLGNVQFR